MSARLPAMPLASAAVAAALLASASAAAQTRVWDFEAQLDGAPIGHHRFTLGEREGERTMTTEARFQVKLLGFTAYRYAHDATEQWRAGCLAALEARTDDNGERLAVKAAAEGNRLAVTGPRARGPLEGCVMTFAYWDPSILEQSRLLNAQTGEYESVKVASLGTEKLIVRGREVPAAKYRITGSKHPIDLWYSQQREWLALESPLDGGRRLRYRLR